MRGLIVFLWFLDSLKNNILIGKDKILYLLDVCDVNYLCYIWIIDLLYVDVINYYELLEFFLVWDKKFLKEVFLEWYIDSKRVLVVRGEV